MGGYEKWVGVGSTVGFLRRREGIVVVVVVVERGKYEWMDGCCRSDFLDIFFLLQ